VPVSRYRRGYQQGELFSFREWFDGDARVAQSCGGLEGGRMNPGAELAWRPSQASVVSGTRSCWAPPCRRRSSRRRSPNEFPGPRSPRALTRPERRRQRQVAAPVHLAPILGYLLALQA